MDSQNPDIPPVRNEINLKEVLLQVQSYVKEILRSWKLVTFIVFLLATFFLVDAIKTSPIYRARLTFMVNQENTRTSGYSDLLTNLGFGAMGGSDYNLDKILELSKSNLIIQRVLLKRDTIGNQEDYLANHLIRIGNYNDEWEGGWLEGFQFTQDSFPLFSRKERSAIKTLHSHMLGTAKRVGYLRSSYSESSGIMNLEITTQSEELSLRLSEVMFDELSSYYIETAIAKSQQTYDRLKEKVDSVRVALHSKQYQLASFEDANRGFISKKASVDRQRLQGEVQMLITLFAETARNLEIASFSLKNDTPFIRAIDRPYSPLGKIAPVWYLQLIKGIFLGLIISIIIVIGRKVFRDLTSQ